MMNAIEIKKLKKSYKDFLLDNVNINVPSGIIVGLIGENGAGKTTFFNCLNEDVDIDSGYFYLEDDYGKNPLCNSDIGYVISTPTVPEFLTAKEFLTFFIEINAERVDPNKTIDDYFELVQIPKEDQDKLLKEYSHGMKNKMQMLINIIANPKVILLDEPLTSLDIVVQEEIKNLLKDLKSEHIIIFSTHILELAMDLCDEIVILNHQKLELVEKNHLNTKKYKDKIIQSLRDSSND